MKRFIVAVLVLGGAGVGGYYATTGRLPWVGMSREEEQVAELQQELGQIRQQWQAAGRAQTFGMDTSGITDVPLARLERLDRSLAELLPKPKTPEARNQAGALRRDLDRFRSQMR